MNFAKEKIPFRVGEQECLASSSLYAPHQDREVFVFVHVLGHALTGLLLMVALHEYVVDGATHVLEDGLVTHQQVSVLEAVRDPRKKFLGINK